MKMFRIYPRHIKMRFAYCPQVERTLLEPCTTCDETVIELKKPIVLNGIPVNVTAQDLLDRTIHIDLPVIKAV